MLNIVCERIGPGYPAEYVNILRDMVGRNLPEGMGGRFVCVTDQPDKLDDSITVLSPGERIEGDVLHLRLDWLIVGPLDKIVARGLLASDVIEYDGGHFPKGTKIVSFPDKKPHECDGWVKEVWKIGGGTVAELVFESNVTADRIVKNMRSAYARSETKWLEAKDAHDGIALIAAGGPSLRHNLASIAIHQQNGAKLFALNNVPSFLVSQGIAPDAHVLLDAIPDVTAFVDGDMRLERYYSSQCDPAVLDAAREDLILWTPYIEGIGEVFPDVDGPFIGGGTTIGTRAIGLAYMLGYRTIHIYGLDSSYDGESGHAYDQIGYESVLDVSFQGKSYRSPPQLLAQVEEFKALLPEIMANGVELIVHGDGLLQDVAASLMQKAA